MAYSKETTCPSDSLLARRSMRWWPPSPDSTVPSTLGCSPPNRDRLASGRPAYVGGGRVGGHDYLLDSARQSGAEQPALLERPRSSRARGGSDAKEMAVARRALAGLLAGLAGFPDDPATTPAAARSATEETTAGCAGPAEVWPR